MRKAGLFCAFFLSFVLAAEMPKLPALQDVTRVQAFRIAKSGDEKIIQLPQLPGKPGLIPVLICRMFSAGQGGCNVCARIVFNDTPLGMLTKGGRKRLLFRETYFHLDDNTWRHKRMRVFNGSNLSTMFAPDADTADRMTTDGKGSFFMFDLSDAAHPVDVNTMTFRNIRVAHGADATLTVQDIQVGYLPVSALPESSTAHPVYAPAQKSLTRNGVRLDCYRDGGFAVTFPGVEPLVLETSLAPASGAMPQLRASDEPGKTPVVLNARTEHSLVVTAKWPHITLERTLELSPDGRLEWYEKWINTGNAILAVPFRYRAALAVSNARRVWMGGSAERLELDVLGGNPTFFFESPANGGAGCGFVTEDDISRLVVSGVLDNGILEIFSRTFALAPGKSRTFHYSVAGVRERGYWEFINALRRRWGAGKYGVERPFFWGATIPVIPGLNMEERIRKNLGNLGPITVCITPWLGRCADYFAPDDSGKSVTERYFASHVPGRKVLEDKIRLYKKLLPNAKVMTLGHPSMVRTYMPEFSRHPYAHLAIRNRDGSPYHHAGYDAIILREKQKQGWSIIYYLPLPGSPLWERLFDDIDATLAAGSDGAYFDEFSFCTARDYRRYDYSTWDGFSADVDENGVVTALKSDNSLTAAPFKNALIHKLSAAGKLFLGNGCESTRAMYQYPAHGFIEGTALINMPDGHLLHVPLVLGNYGTEGTRPGVMKAVREALNLGCVYSPHARTNLVLEGPDNFVCKLYPITVTEIGPGFVAAKERLAVCASGTYRWEGAKDGEVDLYVYNSAGDRIDRGAKGTVKDGRITLKVPTDGLVIAEVRK